MAKCINGQGYVENHEAEGWLCSPDGAPIVGTCQRHADIIAQEYAITLGETWTFKLAAKGDK